MAAGGAQLPQLQLLAQLQLRAQLSRRQLHRPGPHVLVEAARPVAARLTVPQVVLLQELLLLQLQLLLLLVVVRHGGRPRRLLRHLREEPPADHRQLAVELPTKLFLVTMTSYLSPQSP